MASLSSLRLAIFAIALALRLIAIEISGADRISFGDGPDYIACARSLCEQHSYPDRGNLPFFRAPGLPFFIAAVTACHTSATRAIKYALAACDALTCVLIASIAFMLFGRTVAWIAGSIAALDPIFIASVCDLRSEPLFMLLLTLSLFLLLRDANGFAGVTTALAALTRPSALLCIPLFALFRPRRGGVLILTAALTLAPWTIRNFIRYHELIVVNDAGGFNLWRGTHPETIALTHERDRNAYVALARHFEFETISQTNDDWTRRAIANIRAQRRAEALFSLEKAWLYWRPWLNPMEYSTLLVAGSAVFLIPLFGLAAIGLWRTAAFRFPVLIFFATMWIAHIPFEVVMRFRIPFTDPLLIVFASLGVVELHDLLVKLRADRRLRLVRAPADVRSENEPRIVRQRLLRRLGVEHIERQAAEVV
jgi:hypothetical protein